MPTAPCRPSHRLGVMTLLSAAAILAWAGSPAIAQNALNAGSGNALDANLRVGSGGRNVRPRAFSDELAFRNAIVTGNVPGGKGFRGEVGYTAPLDFRGATGANDQFGFRADSFYSGLATRNIRGIDALRQQMLFTTLGQTAGPIGPLIIARPETGTSGASVANAGAQPLSLNLQDLEGSIRSISNLRVRNALEPELLARYVNEKGDTRLVLGSEIEGIRLRPDPRATPETATLPSPTRIDRTAPNAELIDSNLSPHALLLESLRRETERAGARLRGLPGDGRTQADELRPPGTDDAPSIQDTLNPPTQPMSIENMLEMMRGQLEGDDKSEPTPSEDSRRLPTPVDQASDPRVAARKAQLDALEQALLGMSQDLAPQPLVNDESVGGDRYAASMQRGIAMLETGQWFDAEEQFTMALATRPGDSMAAAGRIQSQIGAGMFRSAAINIRNLYRAYPELIPVRYQDSLRPAGERLDLLKRQLIERSRVDTPFALDACIVMAYLGHQVDDPTLRDAGFARLHEINASIGATTDPLIDLLERIWSR